MATIDLITYDQKMVTPKDDALIHQFGISNGVLYGCEVTLANSNTLHITGGQGVIYGRQWEIAEGDITVTLPASGSLKGRLYVKIDLSNTTNPIELLVQTAVTLPDLTDDDQINVDNSVSELEICTFDVSSLTISNLERTVEQVADGDHQDVVDLQADVSEIKSNLTNLTTLTSSVENNITYVKIGNIRQVNFNWATVSNIKSFFNNLPNADKPTYRIDVSIIRCVNGYYGTAGYFSYDDGTTALTHFSAYNSSSVGGTAIDNSNTIKGQVTWLVE